MVRRSFVAVLTALAALGGVLVGAPTAGANPVPLVADPDPFYAAPADIGDAAPGDVLDSRRKDSPAYPNTDIWQIKYRSTNSAGDPIASVTTVLMPRGRGAGTPLVSYQAVVNALGTKCAPSHGLFTDELVEKPAVYLGMVARGWAVAVPDYLGPTAAYGAARMSGQITLDGIRAVQRFSQLPLADSPVGLLGYSGGGLSTSFAAALAPSYAPELKIAGIAEGGIPSDLAQIAQNLAYSPQPHPGFGMAMAVALGLEREYPGRFPITENLNDRGIALRNKMFNECRRSILIDGAFNSGRDLTTAVSLAETPSAQEVLRENSVTFYEGVPTAPLFVWQGVNDFIAPFQPVKDMVGRYCAAGATVQFRGYPAAEHFSATVIGLPEAYLWLDARFRGEQAPSNC
ncbi:lipase family protein [Rhodococcus sp. P1Y]|uniref:lipase family protein n=1 Tax=Rhodococcus sp. P1Y TaxID=1302308 RepID=UPI001912674B